MPLTLSLSHPRGLGGRETRSLVAGTLTIGRAAGNDWVLPDPDRHLSKTHCSLTVKDGAYVLTDLSTNGSFHNGARTAIGRDQSVVIADGDEFRIGEYVIGVTEVAEASVGTLFRPPPPPARPEADDDDPFAAPAPARPPAAGLARGGADPFRHPGAHDLLGDPLDAAFGGPLDALSPIPKSSPQWGEPARPAAVGRRDDPFDSLEPSGRGLPDPFEDKFRGKEPAEQWQGPSQRDDAPGPVQALRASQLRPPPALSDLDLDALLGDDLPGTPPAAPQPEAPVTAPLPVPPPMPAEVIAPPAPPPARPAPTEAGAAGLAAFLAGAGLPGATVEGRDPDEALREAGALFRVMVEGLRDVLMSRSEVKGEFRVERTMLRARDNNALKFSVTAEDALAALLTPQRAGYMPPERAVREAFDDLRSHEVAVMAGVQTALLSLLKRFAPDALEKRLQPGMLDSVLPVARRARTWEIFCATYDAIAREAQDDFHSVFGREFARAYTAQAKRP